MSMILADQLYAVNKRLSELLLISCNCGGLSPSVCPVNKHSGSRPEHSGLQMKIETKIPEEESNLSLSP